MSVIRVKHEQNYVVLQKEILENPNISLKAKGLWAFCMCKYDDWEFHISHLVTVLKEGEKALYSAINELIEFGYCIRKTAHHPDGKFKSVEYELYETQRLKESLPHRQKGDALFRRAVKDVLPSKDSDQVLKEPPPTSKKKPPLKYRTKEEIWRGFFEDNQHREIFDAAWEEYKQEPPGSVKHLIGWLTTVCNRISIEMSEMDEIKDRIKRHKDEARSRDNFGEKNTIIAGDDSVELVFGIKSIFVKYDVSDNEWHEKTDLIFGKRDNFEFAGH